MNMDRDDCETAINGHVLIMKTQNLIKTYPFTLESPVDRNESDVEMA